MPAAPPAAPSPAAPQYRDQARADVNGSNQSGQDRSSFQSALNQASDAENAPATPATTSQQPAGTKTKTKRAKADDTSLQAAAPTPAQTQVQPPLAPINPFLSLISFGSSAPAPAASGIVAAQGSTSSQDSAAIQTATGLETGVAIGAVIAQNTTSGMAQPNGKAAGMTPSNLLNVHLDAAKGSQPADETAAAPLPPSTLAFAVRLGAAGQQGQPVQLPADTQNASPNQLETALQSGAAIAVPSPNINAASTTAAAHANSTASQNNASLAKNADQSLASDQTALGSGLSPVVGKVSAESLQSGSDNLSQGQGGGFASHYVESPPVADRASSGTFQASGPEASRAATQVDDSSTPVNQSDSLRNILLQLKSDDNRRVDVRLIDRGGELHVSVRAADAELAQRFQEHIPELTSRLDAEHFGSEIWTPKLAENSRSESGSSSTLSQGETGSQADSNAKNSGQGSGGYPSQSRPDWVDLLESQIS